jgi:hypothetical protein
MTIPTIEERVTERAIKLERFVGADARRAPVGLISPHSSTEWVRLPMQTRREHLREAIRRDIERQDERTALVEAEFVPGRSYVPCARGCGVWYPARPGRPALVRCARGCT